MSHSVIQATSRTLIQHEDYIMRDHRVHGRRIMPGVTFLDLIYRLLERKHIAGPSVELANVLFSNVVSTSDQWDRRLWLKVEGTDRGGKVTGTSERLVGGLATSGERELHCACDYRWTSEEAPSIRAISVPQLIESAQGVLDLDEVYALARKGEIQHGPFMKGLGRIFQGPDYLLAEIGLSELGREYQGQFLLHPALLDCATAIPFLIHFARVENPRPMIPIHIEAFRFYRRLEAPCYALVRTGQTQAPSADLMFADIELFDAQGQLAAEFRKLSFKTIRRQHLLDAADSESLSASSQGNGKHGPEAVPAETAEPSRVERQTPAGRGVGTEWNGDAPNSPTPQLPNSSTPQLLNSSTPQLLNSSTPQLPNSVVPANRLSAPADLASAVGEVQAMIARRVGRPAAEIDRKTTFYDLGLDSKDLLEMVSELERKYARPFYPTLLFEYNNVLGLAGYLANELGGASAGESCLEPAAPPLIPIPSEDRCVWLAPTWTESPLDDSGAPAPEVTELLVFYPGSADPQAPDLPFADGKVPGATRVTRVFRGDRYRYLGGGSYAIGVANPADHDRLVQALTRQQRRPRAWVVVHPRQAFEASAGKLEAQIHESILPMIRLLRAFLVRPHEPFPLTPSLSPAAGARGAFAVQGFNVPTLSWEDSLPARSSLGEGIMESQSVIPLKEARPHEPPLAVLNLMVGGAPGLHPLHEAVAAWSRTVAVESGGVRFKTVTLDRLVPASSWSRLLELELRPQSMTDAHVAYRAGRRWVREWGPAPVDLATRRDALLKSGGTYLITGGLGGVGMKVAEHLMKDWQATCILIGRSSISASQQEQLAQMERQGGRALYYPCDVAQPESLREFHDWKQEQGLVIEGLFHCAGLTRDSLWLSKPEKDLVDVLAPKTLGTLALDEMLAREPLDFVLLFSSTSAAKGNPGQSDYALANAFLDHFAEWREQARRHGLRRGRTLSINWPLWQEGGMRLDAAALARVAEFSGMKPLDTALANGLWTEALQQEAPILMPLYGQAEKLQRFFGVRVPAPGVEASRWRPVAELPRNPEVGVCSSVLKEPAPRFEHAAETTEEVGAPDPADVLSQLVAVIGLSGRYPQANDLDEFWENLAAGRNGVGEVPPGRWAAAPGEAEATSDGKGRARRWGGFLEHIDQFDSLLFHIAPKDAARMDPEERLMLQTVWETLEDAGYTRETLDRQQVDQDKGIGVFVGCMYRQYHLLAGDAEARGILSTFSNSGLANRISYFFNFKGPSLCLDSACSSSLTAIHLACESLRRGECLAAFAGGVNLSLLPHKYTALAQAGILGSGPLSRSLGDGDGFVPGEGVGGVLLKPLASAIADRDRIYGIIRGSSVNHGGATSGFSVPSSVAEAALIRQALQRSNTPPETINWVEVAANGSSLGDAIEVAALRKVFPPPQPGQPPYCALGSVKPNIGHLEAASGISQLTKVLLQLQRRKLAPLLNVETLNPNVHLEGSAFYLQQQLADWKPLRRPAGQGYWPRRAAISSFGAGGSNAHVIVEEFRSPPAAEPTASGPGLVLISARDPSRLKAYVQRYQRFLERVLSKPVADRPRLGDLAMTSQLGREPMRERLAILASSLEGLLEACESILQSFPNVPANVFRGTVKATPEVAQEIDPEAMRQGDASLAGEDWPRLAERWVQGHPVEWDRLPSTASSRRIRIPFYPFEPRRHWLEEGLSCTAPLPVPLPARSSQGEGIMELRSVIPPKKAGNQLSPEAALETASPTGQPARSLEVAGEVRKTVVGMIADLLDVAAEDIYTDENLGVYGFDSVSITELAARINQTYPVELKPPQFFEFSSVDGLVDYLVRQCPSPTSPPHPTDGPAPAPPVTAPAASSRQEMAEPVASAVGSGSAGNTATRPGARAAEPVAIVGMAAILPESADLDQFWEHLKAGRNLVSEIPPSRWDWRRYWGDPAQEPGKSNSKWGGFIPGVEHFDAAFFGISAREARLMDPQQRLFLQTTWKCLEDAGYRPSELRGSRTGVFVGVSSFDYRERVKASQAAAEAYSATGLAMCMMANRISFVLDWHGPSEAVDTACSSSLVAVHRAVEAIQSGDCTQAIAGGANILLNPEIYVSFSQAGMLSPDGRCKTFDHRADGYVRGEGVGAVFLKPLRQAELDGDTIHGVILASCVNHGGRVNSLTTPNPNVQAELLFDAYVKAGVPAESVGYIEAHGTGTALGDPVEINGIKKAFEKLYARQGRPFSGPPHCGLGSLKSNVGHLESAAGIAGLLKVLLALRHQQLPATLHFERLNPYIDLGAGPLFIVDRLTPWLRLQDASQREWPRRAGVSSFGFGGANAHVVVEEYQPGQNPGDTEDSRDRVVVLSAKSPERLTAYARDLLGFLEDRVSASDPQRAAGRFLDVAFTLQVGREPMDERLAVVARNVPELVLALRAFLEGGEARPRVFRGNAKKAPEATRTLIEGREGQAFLRILVEDEKLTKLAALWVQGAHVDWRVLYPGETPRRISLPTYPFEPERHWVEAPVEREGSGNAERSEVSEGRAAEGELVFKRRIQRADPVLADHVVDGKHVLPGVASLDLVLQAVCCAASSASVSSSPPSDGGEGRGEEAPSQKSAHGTSEPGGDGITITSKITSRSGDSAFSFQPSAFPVPGQGRGEEAPLLVPLPTPPSWGEEVTTSNPHRSDQRVDMMVRRDPVPTDRTPSPPWDGGEGRGEEAPSQKSAPCAPEPGGDGITITSKITSRSGDSAFCLLPSAFPVSAATLEGIVFVSPLVVEQESVEVLIRLIPLGSGFDFEVLTEPDPAQPARVHARGRAVFSENVAGDRATVDVKATLGRCLTPIDPAQLYRRFDGMGLHYGRSFQSIQALSAGADEAIGTLQRFLGGASEADAWLLSPGLLDGALQCIAGLAQETAAAMMPFSVESFRWLQPLPERVFAHIVPAGQNCFDITLLDDFDRVCVRIDGLLMRPMATGPSLQTFAFQWRESPLVPGASATPPGGGQSLIVAPAAAEDLAAALALALPGPTCRINLGRVSGPMSGGSDQTVDVSVVDRLEQAVDACPRIDSIYFLSEIGPDTDPWGLAGLESIVAESAWALVRILKRLSQTGRLAECRALKVVTRGLFEVHPGDRVCPALGVLQGLSTALVHEFPSLEITSIDLEAAATGSEARSAEAVSVIAEPPQATPGPVAFRAGLRFQRIPYEVELPPGAKPVFRQQGVYLIIGGAGGIGATMAESLCRRFGARVALLGRRVLDESIQRTLETCTRAGGEACYIQADASDPGALREAVATIRQRWGAVHGVIHSALVLDDRLLDRMDEATFRAVLRPKVHGGLVAAEVLAAEPLDFMVFFSSAVSFLGSAGQSNYIAACGFEDALAHALRQRVAFPVKVVNWGYWGSVGVVSDAHYQERLRSRGVGSIEPAEGIPIVEALLASSLDQVLPFKAQPELLTRMGLVPRGTMRVLSVERPSALAGLDTEFQPPAGPADSALAPFGSVLNELNAGLAAQLCRSLFAETEGAVGGKSWDGRELRARRGVAESYRRLFDALLELLAQQGWIEIRREGNGTFQVELLRDPREEALGLGAWCEAFAARHPASRPFIDLARPCLEALTQVLRGVLRPVDVLFPGGSFALVEGIYRGNPVADYYHELVASLVAACVRQQLRQGAPVHVLEVGAGTGGTSRFVLKALKPYRDRIVYHFTDISQAFTEKARQTLAGEYPFVRFEKLDLERSCETQGLESHSIDLVFGTNVFHATRAIGTTLGHMKQLLRPGGVLLVDEAVRLQPFATLTFGLMPGWWLFEDASRRIPSSPLLEVEQWRWLLQEAGFQRVRQFDLGEPSHGTWGQAVLIAESNGQVFETPAPPAPALAEAPTQTVPRAGQPEPGSAVSGSAGLLPTPGVDREQQAIDFVRGVFAEVLKMPASRFEPDTTLEVYGVDSLVVVELNRAFEKVLGKLPTSLLFEKNTVRQLAGYFLSQHAGRLPGPFHEPTVRKFKAQSSKLKAPSSSSSLVLESRFTVPARVHSNVEGTGLRLGLGAKILPSAFSTLPARFTERVPEAGEGDSPPSAPPPAGMAIAIVGLKGRYPGARTIEEFWENLKAGRSGISEVPPDRWRWEDYYAPKSRERKPAQSYAKWGGFIEGPYEFDPMFFQISPREAERMDPQERLFLQTAWEAIEDAGYTPDGLAGPDRKVGVFVGVMNGNYDWKAAQAFFAGDDTGACSAFWSIANRVSYVLNFQGPSLAVDTACSSSLTAIHLACQSLVRGECSAAIAGGVNLILHPVHFIRLSQLNMLSEDGRCRSFGAGADGFVDGEGVGAVLLKPLAAALADGDAIYAVIRGSAINAGGKTSGYTVPNPNAQAELVRCALEQAGWDPGTLSYVEAHGTGTSLGDPIEIAALQQALERSRAEKQFCAIGSVKSNIGHLESAAGIAGLTKTVLQLQHRTLVPSLHADPLNPGITFEDTPFRVQQKLADWERPRFLKGGSWQESLRRAGLSSFGAGGANAHLLVEEFPETRPPAPAAGEQLIVLSAHNRDRLREQAQRLLDFLDGRKPSAGVAADPAFLESLAFTLQTGRVAFEDRLAVVASTEDELRAALVRFLESADLERVEAPGDHEPGGARARAGSRARSLPSALCLLPFRFTGCADTEGGCLFLRGETRTPAFSPVPTDGDGEGWVRSCVEQRRLAPVARAWVDGAKIAWRLLHPGPARRRVHLPSYPFAREFYSIALPAAAFLPRPTSAPAIAVAAVGGAGEVRSALPQPAAGLHVPVWREGVPAGAGSVPPILPSGRRPEEGNRLYIGVGSDAERLQRLREHFGDGLLMVVGDGPPSAGQAAMGFLDCRDPAAFQKVISDRRPKRIVVDFGSGGSLNSRPIDWLALKADPAPEVEVLLNLVRAAEAMPRSGDPIEWVLLTTSAFRLPGDVEIDPRQAWVSGFVLSAAQEYPNWTWTHFDVDSGFWQATANLAWPAHLEGAALRGVRAIRVGGIYERTLVPVQFAEPLPSPYRKGGVYVITGGAGGVGFSVASRLAEHWAAQVVLLGRRAADAGIEEKLRTLRGKGGQAIYLSADVCDEAQLTVTLKEVKRQFGSIHGVFHSAGALQDQSVRRLDRASFNAVYQVKARGSVNLAEQLQSEPLDFLVLFSSLTSLTGHAGQANYAAGGAFMDALAEHLSVRLPFPVRVLNWGYWGDVGLAANRATAQRLERLGFDPITPERGNRMLEQAIALPGVQSVPVLADPELLRGAGFDLEHLQVIERELLPSFLSAAGEVPSFGPEDLPSEVAEGSAYAEGLRHLREASLGRLLAVFQSMATGWGSGDGLSQRAFAAQAGLLPTFEPLVRALLDHLEQAGRLTRQGHGQEGEPRWALRDRLEAIQESGPSPRGTDSVDRYAQTLDRFIEAIPQVLTGRMDPMQLLFPKGSMKLVQDVYAGNLVENAYHAKAAAIVAAYVDWRLRLDPDAEIRILEVGAGTGSTTRFVLSQLSPWAGKVTYYYTDVFPAFLRHGESQFAASHPFIRFEKLDLESEELPAFTAQRFDLILAANVLHATRDVSRSLSRLKRMAKAGGLLLISEMTAHSELATMTFGLTKGWWQFQDRHRRLPHGPLLSRDQWHQALRAGGWRQSAERRIDLGVQVDPMQHCLLLGESDGICLQPLASQPGRSEPVPAPKPVPALGLGGAAARVDLSSTGLSEHTIRYLKGVFSKTLKLEVHRLGTETPFDQLGIDSLVAAEILATLEKDFGPLPSILMLDRITIGQLSDYFTVEKAEAVRSLLRLDRDSNGAASVPAVLAAPTDAPPLPGPETARTGGTKSPDRTSTQEGAGNLKSTQAAATSQPVGQLSDAEVEARLKELLHG